MGLGCTTNWHPIARFSDLGIQSKKNDWWIYYTSKGEIAYKCQFENDIKNGYCLYYENDEIVKASKYSEGKKQKEWTDYSLFTKENSLIDLR